MTKYEYWQHLPDGEIYAVRREPLPTDPATYRVTGACGPLHHKEVTAANLPDFHYDDEPELADSIDSNCDEYQDAYRYA